MSLHTFPEASYIGLKSVDMTMIRAKRYKTFNGITVVCAEVCVTVIFTRYDKLREHLAQQADISRKLETQYVKKYPS